MFPLLLVLGVIAGAAEGQVSSTPFCLPACQHGGSCVASASGANMCICPVGYAGRYCQSKTAPPTPANCHPACANGGTCVGRQCVCRTGFSGPHCQISHSPCMDGCVHGYCLRHTNSSQCVCHRGWTGPNCNLTDPNAPCATVKCGNNRRCQIVNGKAMCMCQPGFTGPKCANSTCAYWDHTCMNGGKCRVVASDGHPQCFCTNAWSGEYCQNRRQGVCDTHKVVDCILNSTAGTNGTQSHCARGKVYVNCALEQKCATLTNLWCERSYKKCNLTVCQHNTPQQCDAQMYQRCADAVLNSTYSNVCQEQLAYAACADGAACTKYRQYHCDVAHYDCPIGSVNRTLCPTMVRAQRDLPSHINADETEIDSLDANLADEINDREFLESMVSGPTPFCLPACQHGGSCYNGTCFCTTGWAGKSCQSPTAPPTPSHCAVPCRNGGTCIGSKCLCRPGYIGNYCQIDNTTCTPGCAHGTCYHSRCYCYRGYNGPSCSNHTTTCATVRCTTNRECQVINGKATCVCQPGYSGPNCAASACSNWNHTCNGHGSCRVTSFGPQCFCTSAWKGEYCTERVNHVCDRQALVQCIINTHVSGGSGLCKYAARNIGCGIKTQCEDLVDNWCKVTYKSCNVSMCHGATPQVCDVQQYQRCANTVLNGTWSTVCDEQLAYAACADDAACKQNRKFHCDIAHVDCPPSQVNKTLCPSVNRVTRNLPRGVDATDLDNLDMIPNEINAAQFVEDYAEILGDEAYASLEDMINEAEMEVDEMVRQAEEMEEDGGDDVQLDFDEDQF